MTTGLTKHAEAILRAAGLYAEFYIGHRGAERQAILTACAALFDAGAEAMREKAAQAAGKRAEDRFLEFGTTEFDTNASYYSGRAAETYETLDEEDEAIATAIRNLNPASLRGA